MDLFLRQCFTRYFQSRDTFFRSFQTKGETDLQREVEMTNGFRMMSDLGSGEVSQTRLGRRPLFVKRETSGYETDFTNVRPITISTKHKETS